MARMVNRAFDAGTAATSIDALERAFAANDRAEVEALLLRSADITNVTLRETYPARVLDTLQAGAKAAANSGRARGGLLNPEPIDQDLPPNIRDAQHEGPPEQVGPFILDFDTTNPEASRWAAEESSTKIVAIDAETRIAIQEIINDAFEQGLPARVAAKRIIQLVNLTPRPFGGGPAGPYSWQAVDNLRREMENRIRGTVRRGGTFRNLPVPPGGFTAAQIDKVVDSYAKRLRQRRALNISRTEVIDSANEGQRQLWLQQVEAGNLTGLEKREWIVTPDQRLCPICAPMAGQLVGLKEPFTTGEGALVMGPTAHPSCRCAVALVSADARKGRRPPPALPEPGGGGLDVVGNALRTGRITSSESLGEGKSLNTVRRITTIGEDGVERVGYWKPKSIDQTNESIEALLDRTLRKSGGTFADREVLASQLDDILGTRLVPKTVYRTVDGIEGSLQLEAEGKALIRFMNAYEDNFDEVFAGLKNALERQQDMALFDIIIGGIDRHVGNIILGSADLAAIDNGFAFMAGTRGAEIVIANNGLEFAAPLLTEARRTLWLKRLSDPRLKEAINASPINAAAKQSASDRIDALIKTLGPEQDGNFWLLIKAGATWE